jgi:hypothetical protein
MNNTRTLTAIVAIFVAATLVVGTLAATAQSTYAYFPKKDDKRDKEKDGGNNNGNTVTAQINKQKASQSGFDNVQEQEAENVICTHPGSNSSCVSEGAAAGGGGGGGGGGDNNIVCPDGFVRAFLILHLIPERILDGQICVSVLGQTSPVPPGGCTGGLVAVTIASSDLNVCARVL